MLKRVYLSILILLWSGLVFSNTLTQPPLSSSGKYFRVIYKEGNLVITTTTPARRYANAGIRLMTERYSIVDATLPSGNGYFLFSVSDTQPASIAINAVEGNLKVNLCLVGTGQTYSCEEQTVVVSDTRPTLTSYSSLTGEGVGTNLSPGLGALGSNNASFYGFPLSSSGGCDTSTTLGLFTGIPITLNERSFTGPVGFPLPCIALCRATIVPPVFPGQSAHCTNAVLVTS
ncbi:MAG: hypothetical protein P1U32_03400 [Legionellaceae bacterium]|nr:hypothetical protein [Legionellaceae bacterium]